MKKRLSSSKNLKLKYLLIILIIIIFNIGAVGLFTNSRYFTSVNLRAVQDIGYTIFKLSPYDMENVEGYDSDNETIEIAPREEKTVKYKISNVENDYYNEMNLECYLKVLDENGEELTEDSKFSAQISGIEGASIVAEKGYGPINMDWSGTALDEKTIKIKLNCSNRCIKSETINYYIVAEAFNEAAKDDSTDEDEGVIVRRNEALKLKIYDEYDIEYELNNTENKAIWVPENEGPTSYILGDTVNLEAPICRTQDFDGWYKDKLFAGTKITDSYENGNEDLKFYAKWVDKSDMHNLKVTAQPTGATINYESNEEYVGLKKTTTTEFQEKFSEGTKIKVKVSKEGYETIETEVAMGTSNITKQIEIRKLYNVSITGITETSENANIEYSINVPANSPYIASKTESGTKTGSLSGTYPVGTTIKVTVKKDNCEIVTKSYTVSDSNITDTITIRNLYALNLTGVAKTGGVESNANIAYTINIPASANFSAETKTGTVNGSLTGNYPTGTTVSVTVNKDGFDSEQKNYTMTGNLSEKITITKSFTYTLTIATPATGGKVTFEIESGQITSGDTSVGSVTKSIIVKEETVISWAARADGYYTQKDTVTVNSNKSDTINLSEIQNETYKSDKPISIESKSAESGTITYIDDMASTASDAKSLKYAEVHRKAVLKLTFKIPDSIAANSEIESIVYRQVATNGTRDIDIRIDVCNDTKVLATTNAIANGGGGTDIKSFTFNLGGIKVSDLLNRTITVRVTNLETEKVGANNMYINFKGADISSIVFKPPSE